MKDAREFGENEESGKFMYDGNRDRALFRRRRRTYASSSLNEQGFQSQMIQSIGHVINIMSRLISVSLDEGCRDPAKASHI